VLWRDSTGQSQELIATNEREQEVLDRMLKAKKEIKSKGLGCINNKMPESNFRLMCFMIAYKTGTSLIDVMGMSFFDLFTYSYIVSKFTEESDGDVQPNIPEMNDLNPLSI
jgi:hypothetical protein